MRVRMFVVHVYYEIGKMDLFYCIAMRLRTILFQKLNTVTCDESRGVQVQYSKRKGGQPAVIFTNLVIQT